MSTIQIRGLDVKFPYEKPYDIQIDYMRKVIDCLEDLKHGVLESPTGTGKTLCLFAPVTAWLRSKKQKKASYDPGDPVDVINDIFRRQRVIYTARTHSQIAQTVKEVLRCDIEGLNIRVMGARDQLCVNPDVLQEKEFYLKRLKCNELVKNRGCRFHRNLDHEKCSSEIYAPGEILDIEDLVSVGKRHSICPYFLARKAKDNADIVLMPYNYIIDRDVRDTTANFQNTIVIFDEGHNVASTCEESFEFSFTSVEIALGIDNLQKLMIDLAKMMQTGVDDEEDFDLALHADSSHRLLMVMKALENSLKNEAPISGNLMNIADLHTFFSRAGVDFNASKELHPRLTSLKNDAVKLQLTGPALAALNLMDRMFHCLYGDVISKIISESQDTVERSFKYVVSKDESNPNVRDSKKLSLFCFNPSFGMQDVLLQGVQSVIITSGTLAPLPGLIHELGLPESVTLENRHIASRQQVPFMVLGYGVNNARMDGSFRNRTNPDYVYSLGMTLTNLISSVPDGVLLLFSSYSVMQNLRTSWEEKGIWNRLNSIKRVFLEPRGKEEFINCMENYRRAIDAGNGAILMGVLRGKVSEGMDFKDQYCRGVFIVGVPFPPVLDPRVKGKEKYAESLTIRNPATKQIEKLYGNSYMSVEAMRATNQAIGRVIRHGADYGAMILCDYRFANPRQFFHFSRWLRGDTPTEVNFMTAKKTLREFFRDIHNGKLGVKEVVCQRVNDNGDPIAGNIVYDVYDHKKARDEAPLIARGRDFRNNLGRSSIKYEDLDEEDILSSYKAARDSETPPSTLPPQTALSSCFDVFDSPSTSRIEYKEVKLETLAAELQKRKLEDPSPSLLSRSNKKSRPRALITPILQVFNDEPESVEDAATAGSVKEETKAKALNYFVEVKNHIRPHQAGRLKAIIRKYWRSEMPFSKTVIVVKDILSAENNIQLFSGFQVCVKNEDRRQWEEFIESDN